MQMRGSSVLTNATVGGSAANANVFLNNSSTGFQSNTVDTGNILAMTISNNTFTGNNAGTDLDLSPTNTNMSVTVQNNTYNNHHTTALNLVAATGVTGGTLSATLRGNVYPKSGFVITAGGLVLFAGNDSQLYALDKDTGELICSKDLPNGSLGVPAVYEAGGREYILLAVSGGNPFPEGAQLPPGGVLPAEKSKSYIAFSLPVH